MSPDNAVTAWTWVAMALQEYSKTLPESAQIPFSMMTRNCLQAIKPESPPNPEPESSVHSDR